MHLLALLLACDAAPPTDEETDAPTDTDTETDTDTDGGEVTVEAGTYDPSGPAIDVVDPCDAFDFTAVPLTLTDDPWTLSSGTVDAPCEPDPPGLSCVFESTTELNATTSFSAMLATDIQPDSDGSLLVGLEGSLSCDGPDCADLTDLEDGEVCTGSAGQMYVPAP